MSITTKERAHKCLQKHWWESSKLDSCKHTYITYRTSELYHFHVTCNSAIREYL